MDFKTAEDALDKIKEEIIEFKNQFYAYAQHKEITGSMKHSIYGYISEYGLKDNIKILQDLENQKRNEKKSNNYIAGRHTMENLANDANQWKNIKNSIKLWFIEIWAFKTALLYDFKIFVWGLFVFDNPNHTGYLYNERTQGFYSGNR